MVRKGAQRSMKALSAHLESEIRTLKLRMEWTEKARARLERA
ncbi:MAG: hypothetical protein R3B70_39340 [Polyangiaceae bacterium]